LPRTISGWPVPPAFAKRRNARPPKDEGAAGLGGCGGPS
jgi:hypothetical protein